jgi:hypothetical protein
MKQSMTVQLLCCRRSEFSDDFQDARGFGWEIPGQPKFHWKTLIQKKVPARSPMSMLAGVCVLLL